MCAFAPKQVSYSNIRHIQCRVQKEVTVRWPLSLFSPTYNKNPSPPFTIPPFFCGLSRASCSFPPKTKNPPPAIHHTPVLSRALSRQPLLPT